jgi:hypothetical protein
MELCTVKKLLWGSRRIYERKKMTFRMTTKLAAAAGLTSVILGGIASPMAQADPIADGLNSIYGQLSGVGSDTLQDVDNGLQMVIGRVSAGGDWKLASYDATSDEAHQTLVTKSGGATIYRPNGSGDGRDALLTSIGQKGNTTGKATFATPGTTTRAWKIDGVTGADDQVYGQIQYSRSSSGPTTNISATGAVSYVPFAVDAVDYAVSSTSKFPALSLGRDTDAANGTTHVAPSTLFAIYNCEARRIITKDGQATKLVDNTYETGAGETSTPIHALIPQSSSGTGKFWALKFYGSESASLPSCVTRTYNSGAGTVQEHDGSAIDGDAGGIMPFSIPKWVGMAKNAASVTGFSGVTDVRHGAVLGTLNGIAPTINSGATLAMNNTFLTNTTTKFVSRTIYHVVPYRKLTDSTTPEYTMFNGRTSLVCSNGATISAYGFGVLTATSGPNSCGYTGTRAYSLIAPASNTATATLNSGTQAVDFNLTAFTTTYGGTKGAKIYVIATKLDGSEVQTLNAGDPVILDAGSTSKTFSIPYSSLDEGTWNLGIEVNSNLMGVAVWGTYGLVTKSILRDESSVSAAVTGKAKAFGRAVVTVSGAGVNPTGTVTVYKGTSNTGAVLGTGTLVEGTVTISNLTKQSKKGRVSVFVEYSGDSTYSSSSASVTWNVN